MSLQEEIIAQLGVKPIIDPEEETGKRSTFKAYLKSTFLKSYVLGISGGQDSTLAGRLAQLAVEENALWKLEMIAIALSPFVCLTVFKQMKMMRKRLWLLSSLMSV